MASSALLLALVLQAAPGLIDDTVWQNQSGSILLIDTVSATDGHVSGGYYNQASGYRCQGSVYPLEGRISGEVLTFSVIWSNAVEDCGSLTSWTGRLTGDVITTRWHLARPGDTEIRAGESRFTRLEGETPQAFREALQD